MGRPMFNKSLIQFSVNGQGCVPSLLLGLRPAVVGVMQPSSKGLMPAHTVVFSAPDPTAGHCRPTPLLETPGHSQANLAHSLVRTLLLSPGSWCTQGFVCALQESVSAVLWKFCNQIPLASKVKFSGIILLCPTFPCTIIALGFPAGASGKKTHLPMKESQEPQIWSLGWEDSLEEEMTPHSSILAWVTSWTEEPGRLQPIGLQRVGQDWSNLARVRHCSKWFCCIPESSLDNPKHMTLSITRVSKLSFVTCFCMAWEPLRMVVTFFRWLKKIFLRIVFNKMLNITHY